MRSIPTSSATLSAPCAPPSTLKGPNHDRRNKHLAPVVAEDGAVGAAGDHHVRLHHHLGCVMNTYRIYGANTLGMPRVRESAASDLASYLQADVAAHPHTNMKWFAYEIVPGLPAPCR